MYTIEIPVFDQRPPRVAYYTLDLRAERCPSWHLLYAYEHNDLCLSPSLRPCDLRNGKNLMLKDLPLAEELASYAEPIMQARYGSLTEVSAVYCEMPEKMAETAPFDEHAEKAQAMLEKLKAKGCKPSRTKALPLAPVFNLSPS